MNREKDEKIGISLIAKALIACAAIGHLIFTSIHVKALLLLENEICGFIMFLFVLFGLVCLFESTRIQGVRSKETLATGLVCFLTSGFGVYLVSIYRYAIANQKSLEPALVNKAVTFSMILIVAYVIAGVLMLIDYVKRT